MRKEADDVGSKEKQQTLSSLLLSGNILTLEVIMEHQLNGVCSAEDNFGQGLEEST